MAAKPQIARIGFRDRGRTLGSEVDGDASGFGE